MEKLNQKWRIHQLNNQKKGKKYGKCPPCTRKNRRNEFKFSAEIKIKRTKLPVPSKFEANGRGAENQHREEGFPKSVFHRRNDKRRRLKRNHEPPWKHGGNLISPHYLLKSTFIL